METLWAMVQYWCSTQLKRILQTHNVICMFLWRVYVLIRLKEIMMWLILFEKWVWLSDTDFLWYHLISIAKYITFAIVDVSLHYSLFISLFLIWTIYRFTLSFKPSISFYISFIFTFFQTFNIFLHFLHLVLRLFCVCFMRYPRFLLLIPIYVVLR